MSSYDRHSTLPRLRSFQWHILLNGQLKDRLLPRLRSIRVLTNMLTRDGVFYDLKIRRHSESTSERGTCGRFRKRMGSRARESFLIVTRSWWPDETSNRLVPLRRLGSQQHCLIYVSNMV